MLISWTQFKIVTNLAQKISTSYCWEFVVFINFSLLCAAAAYDFPFFFLQPAMKIYYHYNSISSLWICEKRDVLTKFPSKVVVVVVYKKFYHINHHIALLPYTGSLHSTTWEGLQSSSFLLRDHNFKSIFHFMGI